MFKRVVVLASAALAGAGSTLALATEPTFDVSEAVTTLGGVETGLVAVGGVLIGLAAVAVGFSWIKGMIFG